MKWDKKKDSIYLAVGHGLQVNKVWDSGCAYGKYTEADLMLPIVKAAVKLLRKSGVKVYTDADTENNKNMIATVDEANKKGVTLYMSVHCDYKGATPGVMPLYVSSKGKAFGNAVGKRVAKIMGMKYKGVSYRSDLYELNATNMPSVILETGCIKDDIKYLKQSKKYGRAIAKAILKYIGVPVYVSNRTKIARKANELAYIGHPDKAKYPTGHPRASYKRALNNVYPNRGTWSAAPKAGASCDVFVGTVVRSAGVARDYPRGLGSQIEYMTNSDKFKKVKLSQIKTGDVVQYKKGKKGHTWIYYEGKAKHGAFGRWYGRTTGVGNMLKTKGKTWLRVYRAI